MRTSLGMIEPLEGSCRSPIVKEELTFFDCCHWILLSLNSVHMIKGICMLPSIFIEAIYLTKV